MQTEVNALQTKHDTNVTENNKNLQYLEKRKLHQHINITKRLNAVVHILMMTQNEDIFTFQMYYSVKDF